MLFKKGTWGKNHQEKCKVGKIKVKKGGQRGQKIRRLRCGPAPRAPEGGESRSSAEQKSLESKKGGGNLLKGT